MPFQLKIESFKITRCGCRVVGKLIAGVYFGPENVEVELTDGTLFRTVVVSMGADKPKGWPMLSEHKSTLRLELLDVPKVKIRIGGLLRGIGISSERTGDRISRNDLLIDPLFWASHYILLLGDEFQDANEQCELFTGLSSAQVDEFYRQHFMSAKNGLPWPYFTVQVDQNRFVEVEYAEAAEPQIRYKIGDTNGTVTLGYESGHFSLPAMRWEELKALSKAIADPIESARALLLLFPGVYLSQSELEDSKQSLMKAIDRLNLFDAGDKKRFVSTITRNQQIEESWEPHPVFGWLSKGKYAQRNPESLLSTLDETEFTRIAHFFGHGLGSSTGA